MVFIVAGDFEETFVEHYHTKRTQRHARGNLDLVHVVNFEVSGLFDPIFDERVAQGMLGI